ncbi:glycosyl transferase family 2 [Beutenbergia cavernae DSM 12333]|uniref:Glycosyl transferase family 2 n=1 Tax=Beutenbergia cavernae (strain ATCC BAA-8 / DSM 12333 / CCUG 43141 / JCM 11478 / NBRC 16432 / NCIMB 13614 / HKI 0122) TaxID=471853 RepID=C5C060_BEUC1|nr:glycosyltransferase family 2 protein [Beutenbergia cavernae]ACQ79246.1 glycosyl transferase family 2 [Beutenbergia cavernae DSM 12333]
MTTVLDAATTAERLFGSELDRFTFGSSEIVIEPSRTTTTIGCVIPAYNEAGTIKRVLKALLAQTRLPDVIHVIVNNTTDKTFKIARRFAGEHSVTRRGTQQTTRVFVHDLGRVPDKKVGALNYGFRLVRGADYLLGVDGDTVLAKDAVARLEEEMTADPRIGGISAVYTVDNTRAPGPVASFLLTGQRAQFAAFNLHNMVRGRNMAVLGGQASLFRMAALEHVMVANHQGTPWVSDSEVEDSLLSLQIKNLGYSTKISATARAEVGGMETLRALDGQQVKWNYGAIDLMWPGQRGDTRGQPFHPNLRVRWLENVSMLVNVLTRLAFVLLLAGSLSIDAWVFSPVWLVPPLASVALNLRTALSMRRPNWRDVLFALTLVPAEVYMWIQVGHFVRAWAKFLSAARTDNWAAQARAEGGRGWGHLAPYATGAFVLVAVVWLWTTLPVGVQSTVLGLGWPVLGLVTVLQVLVMVRRLVRRQYGFRA